MSENQLTLERPVNVGKTERVLSAMAGAFIIARILRKRKLDAMLVAAGGYLLYRGLSGHCSLYALGRETRGHNNNVNLKTSIVVNRPRHEVYTLWKNVEGLPFFMKHLGSVRKLDDRRSIWQIQAPEGIPSVQWVAEIVRDEVDKEISWRSLPHSTLQNSGKINFSDAPGGGTHIDIHLSYKAPFGKVGAELGWMLNGVFRNKIEEDIRGFKRMVESQFAEAHPA
jgi:uncharacterized membrane protein